MRRKPINVGSDTPDGRHRREKTDSLTWIGRPLSALSFWSAIVLPTVYVPLFISGLRTTNGLLLFFALFGLHVLALVVGHDHAT